MTVHPTQTFYQGLLSRPDTPAVINTLAVVDENRRLLGKEGKQNANNPWKSATKIRTKIKKALLIDEIKSTATYYGK